MIIKIFNAIDTEQITKDIQEFIAPYKGLPYDITVDYHPVVIKSTTSVIHCACVTIKVIEAVIPPTIHPTDKPSVEPGQVWWNPRTHAAIFIYGRDLVEPWNLNCLQESDSGVLHRTFDDKDLMVSDIDFVGNLRDLCVRYIKKGQ